MLVSQTFIYDVWGKKLLIFWDFNLNGIGFNSHAAGTQTALRYRSNIAVSSQVQKKLTARQRDCINPFLTGKENLIRALKLVIA